MYQESKVAACILAAGSGRRMEMDRPKQFLPVEGLPMVIKTIGVFAAASCIDEIILVTAGDQLQYCRELLEQHPCDKIKDIVCGGQRRQDSSLAGVEATDAEVVLIHDGARPFVSEETIEKVVAATFANGAAIAAVPVKDTIRKREYTLPREELFMVQTPQGFRRSLLLEAFAKAEKDGFLATDDAGLVERLPHRIQLVEGNYDNIKITTREDLPMEIRTGTGFDVHRLVTGRPLILGGFEIPYEKGLKGHSDADVLTHAIMDALLGAAGMGDIGRHFPDDDAAYKGADSLQLLQQVVAMIEKEGYTIGNIDSTLIAQKPKVAGFISAMEEKLAAAMGLSKDRINVAATTTELLGFTGRGEGMAAQATCTLRR